MKRILLAASAVAALALPAVSFAQNAQNAQNAQDNRQDARHDVRQDNRQDKRQNNRQDVRQDNRQDVRRDVRQDNRQDNRQDVRQDNRQGRGWDRNNRNWWRGRAGFDRFAGRRPGFWFTPGRGYYRPDPRWIGYHWRVGGYVPGAYRGFYVQDPYFYHLRPAPYGYRYVYLDNNIVLMSLANGLISQVMYNVY